MEFLDILNNAYDDIKTHTNKYMAWHCWHHEDKIQATPAMSTSRISILPLMLKWFFIPNIFSLYFFAFQLCLCRKRLTWSNGYLEVIFHALDVFSIIFATVYVEVKIGSRMGAILSASAMYMS